MSLSPPTCSSEATWIAARAAGRWRVSSNRQAMPPQAQPAEGAGGTHPPVTIQGMTFKELATMATMDRYTMNRHACSRGELLSCAGSGPPGRRGMLIWAREVEHLLRRRWCQAAGRKLAAAGIWVLMNMQHEGLPLCVVCDTTR